MKMIDYITKVKSFNKIINNNKHSTNCRSQTLKYNDDMGFRNYIFYVKFVVLKGFRGVKGIYF